MYVHLHIGGVMSLREYPKISGKVVCDRGHQIHFELLVSSFCSSWGGGVDEETGAPEEPGSMLLILVNTLRT
jgi:hypothetical protein